MTKFYTAAELGKILHLSETTVREKFRDEPGVFKMCGPSKRYETLRIPEEVAQRWVDRHSRGFEIKARRRAV